MLRPEQFHVGDLASAITDGIALLLPRSEYEHAALIGNALDERYGIILDGDLPFQAYGIREEDPWIGVLIPQVRIEVNPSSCYDPATRPEVGSIIREADMLAVVGIAGPYPRMGRPVTISLTDGLSPCAAHQRAGFREWKILIGDGDESRELLAVNTATVAERRSATLEAKR